MGSSAQTDRINDVLNKTSGFISHYLGGGAGYIRGRFASFGNRKMCENSVGYTGEFVGSTVAGLSSSLVKAVVAGAGLATTAASFGGGLGFCVLGPPGTLPGAALAGSIGAVVGATGGFLFEFITSESFANGGHTGKKAAIDWVCPLSKNCTINTERAMNDGKKETWPIIIDKENGKVKKADENGVLKFTDGEQVKLVCNGTGNYFVNFDYLLQDLTVECKQNQTFLQDDLDENFYDFYCKEVRREKLENIQKIALKKK